MRSALLLALALAGCAPGDARREGSGERPTIVSLNPCADAVLSELAGPEQLLAISHYSHDPRASSMEIAKARRFASTSGTAEEVMALGPDIVVADTFLAPATKSALERAGIRVVQVGIIASREDSFEMIDELAKLVGDPLMGAEIMESIDLAWARARWEGERVPTILWQEGGIVPGEDTLAAAMLEHTGFTLHSAARGLGQGAYLPLEAVLADPPQVVLASGEERMLTHPVLRQLDGVDYRRFDSSLLYCGGPTIIRAVERLAQIRAELN